MSEHDTGSVGAAEDALDWEEEQLPVEVVRSLFITLGKAFRAHQLYDENNPVSLLLYGSGMRLKNHTYHVMDTRDQLQQKAVTSWRKMVYYSKGVYHRVV